MLIDIFRAARRGGCLGQCLNAILCIASLHLASCAHVGGYYKQECRSAPINELVPFAGHRASPSGGGVDLSLHSVLVKRNPAANPNHAWSSTRVFTIMAHGKHTDFGPALVDETGPSPRDLTVDKLLKRINEQRDLREKLMASEAIVLYACLSGCETRTGQPSFAKRLADLTNKSVVAPSNLLLMEDGKGYVAGGGTFREANPDTFRQVR
jgi:hypothetical protein